MKKIARYCKNPNLSLSGKKMKNKICIDALLCYRGNFELIFLTQQQAYFENEMIVEI